MVRLSSLFFASLVGLSAAVTKEELTEFACSASGLDMSRSDAERLVAKEIRKVNAGRVGLDRLKALRETMHSVSKMGMSRPMILMEFFPAAEAGVDPAVLLDFYKGLYWVSGAKMNHLMAQDAALKLASIPADPASVTPVWNTLYKTSNANLGVEEAHRWVFDLVAAGIDAKTFQTEFKANYGHSSKGDALKTAVFAGVRAGAGGLQARYAKDGKLYSAKDFQSFYGDSWLVEWLEAPLEKRVANDGKEYTAQQFQAYYGKDAAWRWEQSTEGLQRRMADDGKTYTLAEFINYYPGNWQSKFLKAPLVADDCAGLNHEGCDSKAQLCQWKWTGDWTESCVVKSTMSAFFV